MPIKTSFEGIWDLIFEDEDRFSKGFMKILERTIEFENTELANFISLNKEEVETLDDLSYFITKLIKKVNKKVVLDKEYFSEKLYFYTSGYPFLVSKLCKIIDEKIMKDNKYKVFGIYET